MALFFCGSSPRHCHIGLHNILWDAYDILHNPRCWSPGRPGTFHGSPVSSLWHTVWEPLVYTNHLENGNITDTMNSYKQPVLMNYQGFFLATMIKRSRAHISSIVAPPSTTWSRDLLPPLLSAQCPGLRSLSRHCSLLIAVYIVIFKG